MVFIKKGDIFYYAMDEEIKILKIMKELKCSWEEAVKKSKERRTLREYF
jgi:hypothetical protein